MIKRGTKGTIIVYTMELNVNRKLRNRVFVIDQSTGEQSG